MGKIQYVVILFFVLFCGNRLRQVYAEDRSVVLVDTGQVRCYSNTKEIAYPKAGHSFFGQDAQYQGNVPAYKDNGNGTVTDLNTGLMWSKPVNKIKMSLEEAKKMAKRMTLGGYSDWRVPNIKELYSLMDFTGYTGFHGRQNYTTVPKNAVPYINTHYFDFSYGDVNNGERYIDAQWLSSTRYVSTTMDGAETLFGVNFADGRIKGYGYRHPNRDPGRRREKKFFVRFVRGKAYGQNSFIDNRDGTVTDKETGLMWMKKDSGKAMNWKDALKYAENLVYAGYSDWRLPNAKELQYIVDYSRSPDTTSSPALDPVFETTAIVNEAGQKDYPFFWTSTTHKDGPNPASNAAYISFGRAIGKMHGNVMDVHGAGAQRSDPKQGSADIGHGPQGDARRVYNYVRCVRGGNVKLKTNGPAVKQTSSVMMPRENLNSRREMPREREGMMSAGKRFVDRLDKNGDGKVSKSEFDGPKDRFSYHDRNGDGYISAREAPKGPPPHMRK